MENYFKLKFLKEIFGYVLLFIMLGLPIIYIIVMSIFYTIKDFIKERLWKK